MWGVKIKEFKTRQQFENFWNRNQNKYQMKEVFINNAYGIEYKPLLKVYQGRGKKKLSKKDLNSLVN